MEGGEVTAQRKMRYQYSCTPVFRNSIYKVFHDFRA